MPLYQHNIDTQCLIHEYQPQKNYLVTPFYCHEYMRIPVNYISNTIMKNTILPLLFTMAMSFLKSESACMAFPIPDLLHKKRLVNHLSVLVFH